MSCCKFTKFKAVLAVLVPLILSVNGTALGVTVTHDTQSDFSPGTFSQTVLQGSESTPEIRLDSYTSFNWTFEDYDISGWTFTPGSGVAEENPAGQIHVRAQYVTSEAYAFANRTGLTIPNQFVAEFRIIFDALQPSGTTNPFVTQPTGGCSRLDIQNTAAGMRVDIFSDRIVSFYREGTVGVNYPTLAYLDYSFNTGQWYTIRFEADFNATGMPVEVYLDDVWIGQLKADSRNAAAATYRVMAYSRASGSGLSEQHVDHARLGSVTTTYYSSGAYTSLVMDLHASSFGNLSWSGPASVYPWAPWVKYAGNPVVTGSALVENILCEVDDPLQQPILYDGKYWMCWSNGSTISLSYSTDPNLMVWTSYSGNPVLAPTPGVETYVYSPNIFKDGSTYYLVYDVNVISAGTQIIGYATAPAPTGPYTKGQYILNVGATGQWDALRVTEPYVFKEGDTYYLYYMGDYGCSGCKEQIGLATTTAALFPLGPEAGGLWTKHGLVLPNGSGPTDWDRGLTADPSIIKVGDTYYMRYTGSYANVSWQLGTAWSDNLYGPWNHPPAPDITLGPSGAWDSNRLVRGAIHYHNGKYYSPYTGALSGYQGGMAYAEPYGADNTLIFETRTSSDGSTWEGWQSVLNGDPITSTSNRYFQYRTTFNVLTGNVSPVLSQVTFDYAEGGFVSLTPPTQSVYKGAEFTLWVTLDAFLTGVKAASFKIGYDETYLTPMSVVNGAELPSGSTVYHTFYPQDSILIDVGILVGDFDGPGDMVGVVFKAIQSVTSTPVTIARSILRDIGNQNIPHLTQDAAVGILEDLQRPMVTVNSPDPGGLYNSLPTLNISYLDNINLNRGYYQFEACTGAWLEIWSYNSHASDTTIDWTVPSVSEGTHTIYFRVADDAGNINADTCSFSWSFTYDTSPPEAPVLLTPTDASFINDNTPYFSWTETAGSGGNYTLQYSQDPTFTTAITISGLTVGDYTPSAPLSDGVWYWHVMAEDAAGNPGDYSDSWSFTLDTEIPPPPTDFAVQPGHNKISLSWTNATSDFDHTVIMRSDWFAGGHGYPEYDDDNPEGPYPDDTSSYELIYSGTGISNLDLIDLSNDTRDVYHYTAFTVDAAGNISLPLSSPKGRATSYWLGDVTKDGNVYYEDLVLLSNTFWLTHGATGYNSEFDIGPTDSYSPKGIPTTDNVVNFEDLVIFALNFAAVAPKTIASPILAGESGSGPLTLAMSVLERAAKAGEEISISVALLNNPGNVKAIRFTIPAGSSGMEFISAELSAKLAASSYPVFFDGRLLNGGVDISLALLGTGLTIDGSGEIATIKFRRISESSGAINFGIADLRDIENKRLKVETREANVPLLPTSFGLSQNHPNPFNPITVISYRLPISGFVTLKIYNIQGQLVRTLVSEEKEAGYHDVLWDGRNDANYEVSTGIYLYRLASQSFSATRKMILIK